MLFNKQNPSKFTRLFSLLFTLVLFIFVGCEKEDPNATSNTPECNNTCEYANNGFCDDIGIDPFCDCGTDCVDCGVRTEEDCASGFATFWTDDLSCGADMRVKIEIFWDLPFVTMEYSDSQMPTCNDPGTATFELPPGVYEYRAVCGWSEQIATVEITDGGCTLVKLTM